MSRRQAPISDTDDERLDSETIERLRQRCRCGRRLGSDSSASESRAISQARARRATGTQAAGEHTGSAIARRCADRSPTSARTRSRCLSCAPAIACSGQRYSAVSDKPGRLPGFRARYSRPATGRTPRRGRRPRVSSTPSMEHSRRRLSTRSCSALQAHEPLKVDELWSVGAFLKFALLEMILEEASALAPSPRLRLRSATDGSPQEPAVHHSTQTGSILIEPLIVFDAIPPPGSRRIYAQMDFETRELYRKRIATVARHSDCSESQVAQAALELARGGTDGVHDQIRACNLAAHMSAITSSTKGSPNSLSRIGFHPSLRLAHARICTRQRRRFLPHRHSALHSAVHRRVLFPVLPAVSGLARLGRQLSLFLLLPATQDAVDLVNNAITAFFDPEPLPKLDFSEGIPRDCTTLVAVPTLLINEKQVRKLVNDLEVRFLANRDPNLHFALLTDLPDSVSKPHEKDSHPLVDLAVAAHR